MSTHSLNYQINGAGSPIIFLHGLFGNLDNLNHLAKALASGYQTIQLDLPNHGLSPWQNSVSYADMAKEVQRLIHQLSLKDVTLIGHSLGGKVAMALTALEPQNISRLIVIDMAPVAYTQHLHKDVFAALHAVTKAGVTSRADATHIMQQYIGDDKTIGFLLKSFHQGAWRFNYPILEQHYDQIIGWQPIPPWPHPVLFICGQRSSYVTPAYQADIARQFPAAKAYIVAGSGHWVHAEKPTETLHIIENFLEKTNNG